MSKSGFAQTSNVKVSIEDEISNADVFEVSFFLILDLPHKKSPIKKSSFPWFNILQRVIPA
jgi:hypothetical protein